QPRFVPGQLADHLARAVVAVGGDDHFDVATPLGKVGEHLAQRPANGSRLVEGGNDHGDGRKTGVLRGSASGHRAVPGDVRPPRFFATATVRMPKGNETNRPSHDSVVRTSRSRELLRVLT